MKILVTGGAGFIGTAVVLQLLKAGHDVVVFDNLETGVRENLPAGVPLIQGDVRDVQAVAGAMKNVDRVVHLAAMVSVAISVVQPQQCWDINVVGTQNLLEAAGREGCKRVVFASSAAVYGDDPVLPKQEDSIQPTASPYAYSKWHNEVDAEYFSRYSGLETVGLRFFNVYGPRQRPDSPYSGVISIATAKLLTQETFTVFGKGDQTRDFVYVEDVAAAILAATLQPGLKHEVFNVGRGEQTSLLELVALLGETMNRKPQLAFAPRRAGDILHSVADVSRLEEKLGFRAKTSLREGLRETYSWLEAGMTTS